jgi:hypothetical protein
LEFPQPLPPPIEEARIQIEYAVPIRNVTMRQIKNAFPIDCVSGGSMHWSK